VNVTGCVYGLQRVGNRNCKLYDRVDVAQKVAASLFQGHRCDVLEAQVNGIFPLVYFVGYGTPRSASSRNP
jgi:hypothetical protein